MATELEQGIELFKKGNVAGAITHLEAAIEQNPQDYSACQYLGAAYQSLGRYDKAVEPMRKAALLQPNMAQARYNLGLALEHAGQSGEAASEMMQALALKPDYARAQEALARLRPAEPSQAPSPFSPFGGTLIAAPVKPMPLYASPPTPMGSAPLNTGPLNAQPQEAPVTVGQAPGYSSPLPTAYGANSGFPPTGVFPPPPVGGPTLNHSKPAPSRRWFSGDAGVKFGLSGGVGFIILIRVVIAVLRVMSNHQSDSEASAPQYTGAYRSAPSQTQSSQDNMDAFQRSQAIIAQQQQQAAASRVTAQQNLSNRMQNNQYQNQQAGLQTQQNMQNMQQMQQQNMQRMQGNAGSAPMPGRMGPGAGFGR